MKKQQIESIYFLRLFAMMMVVLVHVTAAYASVLPYSGDAYQKYHFINRIIRIEAGIFIVITGLVFFYSYIKKPLTKELWKSYYTRRVTYILIPYIIWALIYEAYSIYVGAREFNATEILLRILKGESYYQLHFIFLIVQIYLVLPVFVWIAQKFTFFRRYMWLFGVVLQLVYLQLNSMYGLVSFTLFISSLSTFLLGAWIGVYYNEQKAKSTNKSTIVLLIVALIAGAVVSSLHYYVYTVKTLYLWGVMYEVINTFYLVLGSYVAFRIGEILAAKLPRRAVITVRNIAMYSFGFYLIHPLVLNIVSGFVPAHSNQLFNIEMLIRYILTLTLCYLIIWACHRFLPFANLLYGKLPKKAVFLYKREAQ